MISNAIDNLDNFKQYILESSLKPPTEIHTDGKIHRFSQQDDKDTPCWYIYYPGNIAAGAFGCWKRDINKTWHSKTPVNFSVEEKRLFETKVRQIQKQAHKEHQTKQAEIASQCSHRWERASTVNTQHAYLTRKKIRPHKIKQEGNLLLIPIYNVAGTLVNLQTITPNGDKRFTRGAKKKGCFFMIGKPTKTIYIAEGYATAASIYEATQQAVAVVFDAGNIYPASNNIRRLYPDTHLIIAADNDHLNQVNTGLDKAKEASNKLGIPYSYPVFEAKQSGSDFNDLFLQTDEITVKKQLETIHLPMEPSITDKLKQIDLFDGDKQKSASTILIEIGTLFELFHDDDRYGYAIIQNGSAKRVLRLRSEEFKEHLSHYYFLLKEKGVHTNALQDALNTLEAKAKFSGQSHKVFRRVGHKNDKIYVDLVNHKCEVIEVDSSGWRILEESPVMFIRGRYSKPLPTPAKGGNINCLWRYINVKESDKALIFGWLMGAFKPQGPYPLLNINGIQGSGKTFLTRVLRMLVDPNTADTSSAPRDERDFAAQAYNNWLICLDNLSSIDNWLSDSLCRMSTGGGISSRRLYSDVEEVVYEISRPGIVNGIPDLTTRADLRERCISIELEPLNETNRESDVKLLQSFKTDLPKILGAIFDLLKCAIRTKPQVTLQRKPRLAEFAEWAVAAEQGANLQYRFLDAYFDNIKNSNESASEVSVLVHALQALLKNQREWTGNATDLFNELNDLRCITDEMKRSKAWRDSPQKLSNELTRSIPMLNTVGIHLTRLPRTAGKRLIRIEQVKTTDEQASQVSLASQTLNFTPENKKLTHDTSMNALPSRPSQTVNSDSTVSLTT